MRRILLLALALGVSCMMTSCSQKCDHQVTAAVTKEATCQSPGVTTYTCEKCGAQFTVQTPLAEHDYTQTVTRYPTCAEKGELTDSCAVCGVTKTEEIPESTHIFDFYSLEPSRCTVCGQEVEGAGVDLESPWCGKKWTALGTSLTSEAQGTYVQPLAARSGLDVTNLGVPGAIAGGDVLHNAQTSGALSDADLVTVEFGVNDWFASIPLGKVGDTVPYLYTSEQWNNDGSEEGSFAGACYQIFRSLQEKAPQAVIVFLTEPTGQQNSTSADNCERQRKNSLDLRQEDYTGMAVAVARYMGVRVIDAGRTSMIDQEHAQYLADQIHHTELGGKQYALTVWMELRNVAPLLRED